MQTFDINTSSDTIEGTLPGHTFRPLRYTTSQADEIRVGLWIQLKTEARRYRMDETQGLDFEMIMDPSTSDAQRIAMVSDKVLRYPGVTGLIEGPTVTVNYETGLCSIAVLAATNAGPVAVG